MGRVMRVVPLAVLVALTPSCNGITGISDLEKVPSTKSSDAGAGGAVPEQIAVGRKTSCVIMSDRSVSCWGANPGVAPGAVSSTPVAVKKLKDTAGISIGLEHVCALSASGTVQCWGRNDSGQLGDGTVAPSPEPKAVPSLPVIDTVAVGATHSCAYTNPDADPVQGYCWGENESGQLGEGTQTNRTEPAKVVLPAGSKILRLSPGAGFTVAILSNAGVLETWCWGRNDKGQCGQDPATVPRVLTPAKIPGLPQLERIYAGTDHACGRTVVNKLPWCWGANAQGQIGTNRTSAYELPVAVIGAAAESADTMHVGNRHTCLSKDASLKGVCWGANDSGQFGAAPSGAQPLPSPAAYLDGADGLSMRQAEHGCRILKRVLSCFGSNDSGQLGNGKIEPFGSAVVVKLP